MKNKLLLLLICTLGVAVWCFEASSVAAKSESENTHTESSAGAAKLVTVAKPERNTLTEYFDLTGAVVPNVEIVVASDIADARVTELLVEEGDQVSAGQELARLDTKSLQYQLQQMGAQLKRSEDLLARFTKIKHSISSVDVSEKQLDYEAVKARYDDIKLKLQRATILAPAAGTLYEKTVHVGTQPNNNEPMFRIAGGGKVEIEVSVSETSLPRLRIGQTGEVYVSGFDTPFNASVRRIYPQIDSLQRTAKVRVALMPDRFIPIGTFARLKLAVGQHDGISLPTTAIQQDQGGDYVWVVQNEKVIRKPVDPLFRGNGRAIISGDISADIGEANVVVRAGSLLHEGEVVRIAEHTL